VPRSGGLQTLTDLGEHAESRGVAVLYPNAFGRYGDWDVGCDYCTSASRHGVDDLEFFRTLLRKVSGELPVDEGRVYVAGFSQGGVMAARLACALPDRVAGVATVASLMITHLLDRCTSGTPFPVLMIQGTDDQEFPWDGRVGELSASLGAEETAEVWAERNGCSTDFEATLLPDIADDGTRVERRDYDCPASAPLAFYVVEGGGHTWPDAPVEFVAALGTKSLDINASERILELVAAGRP
jgi:polyhydroxybutyrate depolymerase